MSEPKRNVPPGGRQLADRIAALQRKASGQEGGPTSPTMPRVPSSSSASLSPKDAVRSTSGGAQAVRDRIARFQAGADGAGEKPLVPRSSFGAPAPAPGTGQGSLRPYPGAAGGGSGSWGEGVLRPQLTGGAWLHGGGEGGLRPQYTGTSGPGLRPQMTGGAWGRSPSYSETPLPRMLGSGRDAFLDLDDDSRLGSSRFGTSPGSTPAGSLAGSPARPQPKRGGSFTTAQLDAASAGLQRSSSLRRSVDEGREPEVAMLDYARSDSPSGSLLRQGKSALPNVPTAEPKQAVKRNGSSNSSTADFQLPSFPETPAALPERIGSSVGDTSVSSDVEIEVGNVSAEQMAKMRAKLSQSPKSSLGGGGGEEVGSPLNRPALSERTDASGDADGAERIGRLAIDDFDDDDDESAVSAQHVASSSTATDYGAASTDPSTYSSDPVTEAASVLTSRSGAARGRPSLHRSVDSNESGVLDPARDHDAAAPAPGSDGTLTASGSAATLNASSSSSALATSTFDSNGSIKISFTPNTLSQSSSSGSNTAAQRTARISASPPRNGGAASPVSPLSPSSAQAAQRAREAISLGRNKSQKLRRPPPGMTLSAAEMDQSDDEYEPGWASVISSSRN